MTENERTVDRISDQYVEDICRLDPITATFIGVAGHDDRLPDLSPAGYDARDELTRRAVAAVEAAVPVDEREQVAKEAFLERNRLALELADAGFERAQVSVISSGAHAVREVFDLMPTDTPEGVADIGARLAGVPDALAGYEETLRTEAAAGRVSARRQYVEVAEQVRNWTGQEGDAGNFFLQLVDGLEADEETRARLRESARAASDAFAAFGRFLSEEMVPQGREKEAVGREAYALASRYFLGAEIDLEETYAWGWQELKRLSDEMAATADRILPGATVAEAIAHLDADPERTIASKEEFRDWMQQLADRTIAEMADMHFDIPEPVRRIECMLAPTNDGGIYYTGPSEDFSRPGRMWWSVPEGVDSFDTWRELTTVYHEGVPGHHLQIAQAVYNRAELNSWRRLLAGSSGHAEGWALYAERLMEQLGYLDDPADRLGMLDGQRMRAARVVLDIGVHLGKPRPDGQGIWDADFALEFMRRNVNMSDEFIQFEVNRYLGWPGQAPSYKVGQRIWEQIRDETAEREGDAFDIKRFHMRALRLGGVGLDTLRMALAQG